MTVLTMIQNACDLVGLVRPSIAVTSTDQNVRQMVALLREELAELQKLDFDALLREQTFVTVAAAEQTGAVPDDASRFVNGSFFNRTTQRPLIGPISAQAWQAQQASGVVPVAYIAWRRRNGAFLVTPTPAAGETIAYEYITKNIVLSAAGAERDAIVADSDAALVDETLAQAGLRWRWKQAKGLDYAEDMETYERRKAAALGADGGASPTLNIGGGSSLPSYAGVNIPDGSWPGG